MGFCAHRFGHGTGNCGEPLSNDLLFYVIGAGLGAVLLVDAIKKGWLKHFGISVGILSLAVLLGIAANATSLMATKEYADWSTRGPSDLTITPEGNPKENTGGLDTAYITQWSYGIAESLNLFVPRLFGVLAKRTLARTPNPFNI